MKETLRHQEAFNYYYSLGNERKLSSVAVQYKVTKRSVFKWSKEFNWQQRVEERDAKISQQLNKVAEKEEFLTRADYRSLVKEMVTLFKKRLSEGKIVLSSSRDLETLAKLDLLMTGEATDIHEFRELDGNLTKLTDEELRKLADSNR